MRKTLSAFPLALCGLCLLGLLGCNSTGQLSTSDLSGVQAAAQPPATPTEHSNGIVMDWSTSHTLYPRVGEIHSLVAVQHDARAILSWQAAEREDWHRVRSPRHFLPIQSDLNRDWSISLGTGGVALSMYPAKFNFDINAVPSCANDFVVYPVNVAGGSGQPNIVAFNNLYSGTNPTNGICNRTLSGSDTGVAATTFWSYNITAAGGHVATSPTLSLDGTKVAFVETGSATTAHFHVLAWKSGDGVNASNLQSVTSPISITSGFSATTPAAGAVTDLALATGTTQSDTLSSPFVDYENDVAYIGNDSGVLFRVMNVFCTTSACISGGTPAPSLDPTWGSGGALATGCSGTLTGAVVDGGTGNIFVGCSDGKVYGFTSTGAALTNPTVTVGNGTATGGVVDPPLIDAVNGFLYAASGASGASGPSVIVQAKTADLSSPVSATLGSGGRFSLHAPAFNDAYRSSLIPANWLLYEWAVNAGDTQITLYGVGFSAGHAMNAGAPTNVFPVAGSTPVELSPVTEFLNGATDRLFVGGQITGNNFIEEDINTFPSSITAFAAEGTGSSGIIVDNTSGSGQASSIYFGTLVANTAVKLTQSGLH